MFVHAVDMLEHLLELEYQFGNLPEYNIPAMEDVLTYYQMVLQLQFGGFYSLSII